MVEVALEATAVLATATARQRVVDGIKSGKYQAPKLPEGYDKPPQHREETCDLVVKYIQGVRAKTNMSKDGKFPLLGCSGMKGIGKTAMLVHGARRLVPGLGQDVKAFYLTFNGGGARKKNFLASLRRPGGEREYDDAFGHMLMACCGVERDVAQHLGFDDCLGFCRSLLGLDGEAGTVVFFVDEIGDLEDKCTPTLSALMSQMDQQHGKLAFVFAHIQQEVLNDQQTSGREVIPLPLPALPIDIWKSLHRGWVKPAAMHPGLHQLLLACCGHPRALVDGLPAALEKVLDLLTAPTEGTLRTARDTVMTKCKFNKVTADTKQSIENVIHRWFDFVKPMKTTDLARDGLLITVPGKGEGPAVQLLHPLVIQHWADRECTTSALAFHLHQAYAADSVVGPCAEKKMEAIMYHYEAVLRKTVEGKVFPLQQLYQTEHIGEKFRDRSVSAKVPAGTNLVRFLPSFSDVDEVLGLLKQGFIVVSQAHGEVGIEYLSPYVDVESEELIVAAVQCKFINTSTDWGEIKSKMLTAVEGLRTRRVRHFPVVYTTADQHRMNATTYADGIYFIESDLFAFTHKLGVLRLHCEKLGQRLGQSYPWLRRAGSASDD